MANNQFLTVQDVYDPVATALNVQNIDDAKIRNRINAMKAREQFQTMQRKEKWASMANDPSRFNPMQEANQFQPGQSQGGQPTPNRPPMPQNPAVAGANPGVQAPGVQVMPGQPQPQQMPVLSDEDKAADRGGKKLAAMGQSAQGLAVAAKNDPTARKQVNKIAELANNDPDVKAYAAKNGFDEFSYHMDEEKGEGEYTLSRDWSKELLEDFAAKAPNGQLLKPLAEHPGKYRIIFGDAGQVKDIQFIGGSTLTKEQLSSDRELANLAISEPDSPRGRQAQKILDAAKETKKELKSAPGAAGPGGESRAAQFAKYRMANYLDTKDGNRPITLSASDIMEANKKEPGRYLPAGIGEKALTRTATVEDISDANQATKLALNNLKTDFTPALRMKLAQVFTDRNPASAFDNFMGSSFAQTLTPDQQDYVVAVNQNIENAMAMRSVLGAGQGSQDLRSAIQRTIPGMLTGNKQQALKQIDAFNAQLMRLARAIPKVKLRGQSEVSQNLKDQSSKEIPKDLPDAKANKGKRAKNPETGESYLSDGVSWKAE